MKGPAEAQELPRIFEGHDSAALVCTAGSGENAGHTAPAEDDDVHHVKQSETVGVNGAPRNTNVQVFLRMRPTSEPTRLLEVRGERSDILVVRLPRKEEDGVSILFDNSRHEHTFFFNSIFPMNASQEEVFEKAAVPVLQDLMKGVNGTIFAYGQTGTGKTFTITGGAECYKDRGLIPRALSFVFDKIKEDGFTQYSISISYLEIYQEKGYDLLTTAYGDARRIEDLQKVVAREDEDGELILRGLSVNRATTEEEALHLLFLGDTNRIVAETPMNDSSTRSHCIFIIWVEARETGASVVRRSKLHLVDLAGSERVKQTGINPGETIFREACSINLALHYLEQVIVALHERTEGRRVHVPYRNSMMTSVLRDSLGGNCHTVMVATITPEKNLIPETVSTCRFAQAVARIENHATVNEEIDPYLLIKKLTEENAKLRAQVGLLQSSIGLGRTDDDDLTEEDKKKCEDYVDAYLEAFEEDPDMQPVLGPDARKARLVFKILRDRCVEARTALQTSRIPAIRESSGAPCTKANSAEAAQLRAAAAKLRLHVRQRDAEICILLDMLNKNGMRTVEDMHARRVAETLSDSEKHTSEREKFPGVHTFNARVDEKHASPSSEARCTGDSYATAGMDSADPLTDERASAILLDRGKAFEVFRRSVRRSSISSDNKALLKDLYEKAKRFGDQANQARSQVAAAATRLEKLRVAQALVALPAPGKQPTDEEISILSTIEENRAEYIRCAEQLRAIKADIQRLVHLNELNRRRLQHDFETWLQYLITMKTTHECHFPVPADKEMYPCAENSMRTLEPDARHCGTHDLTACHNLSKNEIGLHKL